MRGVSQNSYLDFPHIIFVTCQNCIGRLTHKNVRYFAAEGPRTPRGQNSAPDPQTPFLTPAVLRIRKPELRGWIWLTEKISWISRLDLAYQCVWGGRRVCPILYWPILIYHLSFFLPMNVFLLLSTNEIGRIWNRCCERTKNNLIRPNHNSDIRYIDFVYKDIYFCTVYNTAEVINYWTCVLYGFCPRGVLDICIHFLI